VLEVGSYVGAFLAAARDAGLNASGVDINPAVNKFTRSLGFQVQDGELGSIDLEPVDAITIWNTFDQLSDPRGTIVAALRHLKPGGVLAIRVPNGAYYRKLRGSRRPRAHATLALNNLLTFPYRWGFTPGSLRALLEEVGFSTLETLGDVLVPTSDEWTRLWARIEERMVKWAMLHEFESSTEWLPWFEVYAERRG
jgi:SAM-dependent methyltransferase